MVNYCPIIRHGASLGIKQILSLLPPVHFFNQYTCGEVLNHAAGYIPTRFAWPDKGPAEHGNMPRRVFAYA